MVQLVSLKLKTEGEKATVTFLESLGCSDVGKAMRTIRKLLRGDISLKIEASEKDKDWLKQPWGKGLRACK
jgi:hypothetical protein